MTKPLIATARVTRFTGKGSGTVDDLVAAEEPLEIRLGFNSNGKRTERNLSVTMRTPGNDFELALGFLYTEGIISGMQDVLNIRYCARVEKEEERDNVVRVELSDHVQPDLKRLERNFYTTSSCGVCGKSSIEAVQTICPAPIAADAFTFSSVLLMQLPAMLRKAQNVFEYTGGLHASALFDREGKLVLLREDVGRHNALDKVIGAAMGKGLLPLSHYLVLLSGRASFELIQKAMMAGVPVVAAVGAPSSLAVQMARQSNITLAGFLKEDRFNLYSGEQRIYHEDPH